MGCGGVVASERDGVAVGVEAAGWPDAEAFELAGELVAAGLETVPGVVAAAAAGSEGELAGGKGGAQFGDAAGGGDLAGVGVDDVGVAAPGVPGQLGDLFGTGGLADASPVVDAQGDGGVGDDLGALGAPAGVGAGAGLLAGGLEEPSGVALGVAEGGRGDGVGPRVERAELVAAARRAAVPATAADGFEGRFVQLIHSFRSTPRAQSYTAQSLPPVTR